MSGEEDARPAAAPTENTVVVTVEEYAALSAAERLALAITQSRRKKLDKLLAIHLKKADKAAAAAALRKDPDPAGKTTTTTMTGTALKKTAAPAKASPKAKTSAASAAATSAAAAEVVVDPAVYQRPETPKGECKRLADIMAPTYMPRDVEACWYEWWDAKGFFKVKAADAAGKAQEEKFVMVIPPPNVTGSLHLGHALMCAVQDAMTRWHRMHGRTALYLPGVDHAGIATQAVVESQLKRMGKPDRHALGREKFVAEVWKWKEEYGSKIMQQMKRIGSSLDWDREEFTMSDRLSAAVKEAFVRFYDDGLIYRDTRLVNWSCVLRTAISDIEVDKIEINGQTMRKVPGHSDLVEFGVLTEFAYKLRSEDGKQTGDEGELVVATTRLETMLGDTAVAVHPEDPRYKHLIGRKLIHPFVERDVPIIGDAELVDMDFGTGAVKVTPAHDPNDYACGRRHGLPEITMLTETGCINEQGGSRFKGMMRYVARVEIEKALNALGLLRGKKPNAMVLGICNRSGDVIEPLLKPQWWVNCKDLAKRSADAVRNGELRIVPDSYTDTWYRWLDGIHDWCVSRQLWWGHRIPAYRVTSPASAEEVWVVGRSEKEARERAAKKLSIQDPESIDLVQDDDVLDTWFSSGLFPFSVFGWPDNTEDMAAFFPTSVLETGYDILFFWVARMVMMSIGLTGKLPFHTVCLHTMVRDKRGRKMSKSLGNVIDPLYVIDGASLKTLTDKIRDSNLSPAEVAKAIADKETEFPQGIPVCGADSLRMGLLAYMSQTGDINLDVARVIGYRNFGNKLWNATRFAITNLGAEFVFSEGGLRKCLERNSIADRWILSRLNAAIVATNEAYDAFRLGDAVQTLYGFWMNDLCAVYLENMKPVMRGEDEEAKSACRHVLYECLYGELRLLHPMMPFVTEELYQRLPGPKPFESIAIASFPRPDPSRTDPQAELAMDAMKRVIQSIRSTGVEFGLKPSARPEIYVVAANKEAPHDMLPLYIKTLAPCGSVNILTVGGAKTPPLGCAAKVVDDLYEVHVVLSGLVDFRSEIAKLEASARDKQRAIRDYEIKMSAEGYELRVPESVRIRNLELKEKREGELSAISALSDRFRDLLSRQGEGLH